MLQDSVKNIFAVAELRKRVLFTLGMLAVYRIGSHVTIPGINKEALAMAGIPFKGHTDMLAMRAGAWRSSSPSRAPASGVGARWSSSSWVGAVRVPTSRA